MHKNTFKYLNFTRKPILMLAGVLLVLCFNFGTAMAAPPIDHTGDNYTNVINDDITGDTGAVGTNGGNAVKVAGSGTDLTINSGIKVTGGEDILTDSSNTGGIGINLIGADNEISNAGSVTGGDGISIDGDNHYIVNGDGTNAATITGGNGGIQDNGTGGGATGGYGIRVESDAGTVIVNHLNSSITGGNAVWGKSTSGGYGVYIKGNAAGSGYDDGNGVYSVYNAGIIKGGNATNTDENNAIGGDGLAIEGAAHNIYNNGEITGGNSNANKGLTFGGYGIRITDGNNTVIKNDVDGKITGGNADNAQDTTGGDGLNITGDNISVTNDGKITGGGATASGNAKAGHGLYIDGDVSTIVNNDTITGGDSSNVGAGSASGHGMFIEGSTASITNKGTIQGGGDPSLAVAGPFGGYGLYVTATSSTIVNDGTISGGAGRNGGDPDRTGGGRGLVVTGAGTSITNSGTITAGTATGASSVNTGGSGVKLSDVRNRLTNNTGGIITAGEAGGASSTGGSGVVASGGSDTVTVINDGTINTGGASLSSASTGGGGIVASSTSDKVTVTNDGAINIGAASGTTSATGGDGIAASGGTGAVDVTNDGDITIGAANGGVTSIGGNGIIASGATGAVTVTNGGDIAIGAASGGSTSNTGGTGIDVTADGAVVSNTGTITSGAASGNGTNTGGYGLKVTGDGGAISNSGDIDAGAASGGANTGGTGLYVSGSNQTITNDGEITGGNATGGSSATGGDGLYVNGGTNVITNTGTISAGLASGSSGTNTNGFGYLADNSNNRLVNSGTINGNVTIGTSGTGNSLSHSGDINGNVNLGTSGTYYSLDGNVAGNITFLSTNTAVYDFTGKGGYDATLTVTGSSSILDVQAGAKINVTVDGLGLYLLAEHVDSTRQGSYGNTDLTVLGTYHNYEVKENDNQSWLLVMDDDETKAAALYHLGTEGSDWNDHTTIWREEMSSTDPVSSWGPKGASLGIFMQVGGGNVALTADATVNTLQFITGYTIQSDPGALSPYTISGYEGGDITIRVESGADTIFNDLVLANSSLFVKTGNGMLTLMDVTNTTTATSIKAGTLSIGDSNYLANGLITINGGTLKITDTITTLSSQNFEVGEYGGTISVNSGEVYTVNTGVSDVSGEAGVLIKKDTGKLVLTTANTYSGGTYIAEGVMSLQNAQGAGSGDIELAAGAELNLDIIGNETVDNAVYGPGTLSKDQAGTINMSNDVAVNTVTVNDGVLNLDKTLEMLGDAGKQAYINVAGSTLTAATLIIQGGVGVNYDLDLNSFTFDNLQVAGYKNSLVATMGSAGTPLQGGGEMLFTLSSHADYSDAMLETDFDLDLSRYTLKLAASGELAGLVPGVSEIKLISQITGDLIGQANGYSVVAGATQYNFVRTSNTGALVLGYANMVVEDSAKAYLDGAAGGLAALVEDGIAVGTRGISEMLDAAEPTGRGIITIMEGGHMRVNTGSHVDVDHVLFMGGPVWGFNNAMGGTRLGVIAEAGSGSYDTYNSFSSGAVRGDGDTSHYGIALLFQHDFETVAQNIMPYINASAR